MNRHFKTTNHSKHLLLYHVIFSTKFRLKTLMNRDLVEVVKFQSKRASIDGNFIIHYMEVDEDHIHYMLELKPSSSASDVVAKLKQYTAYYAWQKHSEYLRKFYWRKQWFWTRGYFDSIIGQVSQETIANYIENQW